MAKVAPDGDSHDQGSCTCRRGRQPIFSVGAGRRPAHRPLPRPEAYHPQRDARLLHRFRRVVDRVKCSELQVIVLAALKSGGLFITR